MSLEERIKIYAKEVGFDACGIAAANPLDEPYKSHFLSWLNDGCAADMNYMNRNVNLRINPRELLPNAESMIMVLLNYYPNTKQPDNQPPIATYAYGNDYHYIIKSKLNRLVEMICGETEGSGDLRGVENEKSQNPDFLIFCDSAPVMERAWAAKAGLGWIGKSSLLINPNFGTYTFIGTLITSLKLNPDTPMPNQCGNCTACLDGCPTKAITKPYWLDARKCLSYHTIESRKAVPEFDSDIANSQLYGCDICQSACPWNRFATPHQTAELNPIKGLFNIEWSELTRSQFKNKLKLSAMQRAGYQKIRDRAKQINSTKPTRL